MGLLVGKRASADEIGAEVGLLVGERVGAEVGADEIGV